MQPIEITPPLKGELNTNFVVRGFDNHTFLRREPYDNPSLMRSIWYEYAFMGFFKYGGNFRRREKEEQYGFSQRAYELGLRVLSPHLDDRGTVYYPFLDENKTLDRYLTVSDRVSCEKVTFQSLTDLRRAHELGIIYGDRWPPNILVSPYWGLVNVDFDIELSGKCAMDFEIAQVVYYTIQAGKEKVIPVLFRFLSIKDWFDLSLVKHFVKQHALYFQRSEYGGAERETETLLEILH